MPEERVRRRAQRDKAEGKSASTQAGEFVREEIDHVRAGKHGARSAKQAIAIGLSKARRAGVALPPPKRGTTSDETRRKAKADDARGRRGTASRPPSARRSRATRKALEHEGHAAASRRSLSRQATSAAARRIPFRTRNRLAQGRAYQGPRAQEGRGKEGGSDTRRGIGSRAPSGEPFSFAGTRAALRPRPAPTIHATLDITSRPSRSIPRTAAVAP